MTKEISEKQREQQHLDHVLDLINDKEKELKSSIKSAEGEARDINSHFFDDVKLDYDGYSTSMETALSIHQQQQLLSEREHAWQHSAKQLDTIERLKRSLILRGLILRKVTRKSRNYLYWARIFCGSR